MSTALSLQLSWYKVAKPSRDRYWQNEFPKLQPPTFENYLALLKPPEKNPEVYWKQISQLQWQNNHGQRAERLYHLIGYLRRWKKINAPDASDLEALKKWSKKPYSSFKGMVHGIAEAGHEQMLWYLDGIDAVKVDVHITSFVSEAIGRTPQRPDFVTSIRSAAREIGITPTPLDARIWDWKQKGN